MFSRTIAASARSMAARTAPSVYSGPAMSRYFSASTSLASTKVFVGGISWNTDENALRDTFESYGTVENVAIPINPEGRSKGFAFVEFSDEQPGGKTSEEVAKEAMEALDGSELDGRNVSVKEASPQAPREGGGYGGGRGGGGGYGGRGGGYGGDRRGGGGGYGGGGGGYGGDRRGGGGGYGGDRRGGGGGYGGRGGGGGYGGRGGGGGGYGGRGGDY